MDPLPDFAALSDDQLKQLIGELQEQEREVSYQRRLLHGKIDILRAELVARLQTSGGKSVLDQVDVDRLTEPVGARENAVAKAHGADRGERAKEPHVLQEGVVQEREHGRGQGL